MGCYQTYNHSATCYYDKLIDKNQIGDFQQFNDSVQFIEDHYNASNTNILISEIKNANLNKNKNLSGEDRQYIIEVSFTNAESRKFILTIRDGLKDIQIADK
jgi:hypothetical protein